MIRIYSAKQALSLRDTIPELAVIRSLQFMGDGYIPEEDGSIYVFERGDKIPDIVPEGLFDENGQTYESIEAYWDNKQISFEIFFLISNSSVKVAIVPDEPWLDTNLRATLLKHSTPPQPLPTLKRRAL